MGARLSSGFGTLTVFPVGSHFLFLHLAKTPCLAPVRATELNNGAAFPHPFSAAGGTERCISGH